MLKPLLHIRHKKTDIYYYRCNKCKQELASNLEFSDFLKNENIHTCPICDWKKEDM